MSRRPRVFVVNEPMRRDPLSRELVRFVDLTTAEEFGEIVHLLPPGQVSLDSAAIVAALSSGLRDYRSTDYVLATGDLTACILAASIAAYRGDGRYSILRWDQDRHRYVNFPLDLGDDA